MSTTHFLSLFDKQYFVHNGDPEIKDLDIFFDNFALDDIQLAQVFELYKIFTIL